MSTGSSPESKRNAMRVQGIQNDVFMLDILTKARYDEYTEELTKSIRFTWQLALAGAVLLLVAVGLYNTYTSRQLALRTRKLTNAAKQIADGNLTVQLAQTKGRDELDELNESFRVMIGNLRNIVLSIDQSESAVKQIYTAVEGITQAMNKVKTSVAQSQELFREQEKATSSTGELFTEISGKVQQIASQVSKLSSGMNVSRELSVQVQQAIENISTITQQSAAGSEEITASTVEQKRSFEKSAEKVKELRQIREEMQRELDRFQVKKTG